MDDETLIKLVAAVVGNADDRISSAAARDRVIYQVSSLAVLQEITPTLLPYLERWGSEVSNEFPTELLFENLVANVAGEVPEEEGGGVAMSLNHIVDEGTLIFTYFLSRAQAWPEHCYNAEDPTCRVPSIRVLSYRLYGMSPAVKGLLRLLEGH